MATLPDSETTRFDLTKPEDGASEDTWGPKLNGNFDAVDELLYQLLTTALYGANSGTADALAVALDPVLQSLSAGQRVFVKCAAANTGAVTLAVDSLGVKDVVLNDGTALAAGVLKNGGVYGFIYDGAAWRLQGERALATTAEALAGANDAKPITAAALAGLNSTSGGVEIIKLPGGWMIQAGSYAGGSANPTVNFPVAFSATPKVTITAVGSGSDTNVASLAVKQATLGTKNANGFTAYCSAENEISDVFVSSTAVAFEWIAVGKVATA